MPTRSALLPRVVLRAGLAATLALACLPARAFDGTVVSSETPSPSFKSPKAALRAGLEGVRAGHARAALAALQYAADGGEALAQWKLGKMYAAGDGVPRDDVKAFDYFSRVFENYDDEVDPRDLPFISNAFVAIATYNLNGIHGTRVSPNPERALEIFHFAAVTFGDASAQYNLARMYLDGNGTAKDVRQAARWLHLAADKGHVASEALLGQLLFNGYDGVPPQRAKGLMWLSLARDGVTDKAKENWILERYREAMGSASDADRQVASLYLEDHGKRRN